MNLATREAYGNTLAELKDNENVVVLGQIWDMRRNH